MLNLLFSNWKLALYAAIAIIIGCLYWRISYLTNANDVLRVDNSNFKAAQIETLKTIDDLKKQREVDLWAVRETMQRDKDAMQKLQNRLDAIHKEQDAPCAAVLVKTIQMLKDK